MAEYRFQVELNWRRSEYFFVLNIGVLIAALSLFSSDRAPQWLVALLFLVGALLAFLSIMANETQHGYYTAARQQKANLEARLGLKETALATTPGMGSAAKRLGRVGTFLKTMLIAIAVVDLAGGVVLLTEEAASGAKKVAVVVKVRTQNSNSSLPTTVAVSDDSQLLATRTLDEQDSAKPIRLEPGSYQLWANGRADCSRRLDVSQVPFQAVTLAC
ncbi:MAG TPA: hypothetical protein VFJ57_05795 [Solirubrobacterales bacterium]|nr:hypothetical protein [Solirubrobacterales bacterium]